MNCLSNFKQFNLFEQISELNHLSKKQPTGFVNLLKDNFDIKSFLPESFIDEYYSILGRDRQYPISAVLSALLLMHMFNIPTTKLLTLFLTFSTEPREFCGFYESIPDDSFFSRFKIKFEKNISDLFDNITIKTIEICEKINDQLNADDPNKDLSYNLIYDTFGLKPRVKENNPKFLAYALSNPKYIRTVKPLLKIAA